MATDPRKVDEILGGALELPPPQRAQFVLRECGANAGLQQEVLRLIRAAERMDGAFLDLPAFGSREIAAGDILGGRFRIRGKLGEGGMGCVYLADDEALGEVALKTVRGSLRSDPKMFARLQREIRVVRGVSHPNLCPVFDWFEFQHGGLPVAAFTMKYLKGQGLDARLASGPLRPNEALHIARGAAAGLDALHAAGVIHRDIKPGNVMLLPAAGGPVPVIMDFGLALNTGPARNAASTSTTLGAKLAGSPDYMAPEQFRSRAATRSSDIYSFGALLFESVTGRPPFPKEDLLAGAIRRSTEAAPRPSQYAPWLAPEWDAALASALDRNPDNRPGSAAALVERLSSPLPPPASVIRQHAHRSCCHRGAGRVPQGRRVFAAAAGRER